MDFFKPPVEDEKQYSLEELEYQNEKGYFSNKPEKEDKNTYEREIVVPGGTGEI